MSLTDRDLEKVGNEFEKGLTDAARRLRELFSIRRHPMAFGVFLFVLAIWLMSVLG